MKKHIIFYSGIFVACYSFAQDPTALCATELKADARVQILADKLVFDETKWQSLEVLANKTKPTAKEKVALSIFAAESERCLDLGAEWRLKTYPAAINTLINTFRVEAVTALSDLYAGGITYGDLARFRVKKANELKISMGAVYRDVQAQKELADKQRDEALAKQRETDRQADMQREAITQQQQFARQQQEQARQQQEQARRQALVTQMQQNFKAQQDGSDAFFRQLQQAQVPLTTMQQTTNQQTTNCTKYGNSMRCITN